MFVARHTLRIPQHQAAKITYSSFQGYIHESFEHWTVARKSQKDQKRWSLDDFEVEEVQKDQVI